MIGCTKHAELENDIAFVRLTNDYWQIWTMSSDGSNIKQLTKSPMDKRVPDWVTNQKIIYRNNNNEVFIYDVDSGKETQMIASMGMVDWPTVSPDGKTFAFIRYQEKIKDDSDIWLTCWDDCKPELLLKQQGRESDLAWSPSGEFLIFTSGQGYLTHELYKLNIESNKVERLTKNKVLELQPAVSPNGRNIVYTSNFNDDYEIWSLSLDNLKSRRLTNQNGMDIHPCWSPDGNEIVFVSNRSGSSQLWKMNAQGDNLTQLTYEAPSIDPAWK